MTKTIFTALHGPLFLLALILTADPAALAAAEDGFIYLNGAWMKQYQSGFICHESEKGPLFGKLSKANALSPWNKKRLKKKRAFLARSIQSLRQARPPLAKSNKRALKAKRRLLTLLKRAPKDCAKTVFPSQSSSSSSTSSSQTPLEPQNMRAANRVEGVAPLGVFFDVIDEVYTDERRPLGSIATLGAMSILHSPGTAAIYYRNYAGEHQLAWQAPGDAPGAWVTITNTKDATYTLRSDDHRLWLLVKIPDPPVWPDSDTSATAVIQKHLSGVAQPRAFNEQPAIPGVYFVRASYSTALGSGRLQFQGQSQTLAWAANGEALGPPIDISSGGWFSLASSSGSTLTVWVRKSDLAASDITTDCHVVPGGVWADWASWHYHWDFADPAAGFWSRGAKKLDGSFPSKNEELGWAVAHVFERPGVYPVILSIRDESGNSHFFKEEITVSSQPAAGWSTLHFAADGDDASGDGSQQRPFQSVEKARTLAEPNMRLLFRRGDVFPMPSGVTLRVNAQGGPIEIAAWGPAAEPPRLQVQHADIAVDVRGAEDPRLIEIELDGPYPELAKEAAVAHKQNLLVLRSIIREFNGGFVVSGSAGAPGTIIQDSVLHNFKKYPRFPGKRKEATLGNEIYGGHEEALYRSYSNKSVTMHNFFHTPLPSKCSIRFHSGEAGSGGTWQIASWNHLLGVGISGGYDGDSPQFSHYVFENNFLDLRPRPAGGLGFSGVAYLTARNNIIYSDTSASGVSVGGSYNDYGPYDVIGVNVVNNLLYVEGKTSGDRWHYMFGLRKQDPFENEVRAITVMNNIIYAPLSDYNHPSVIRAASHPAAARIWRSGNNLVFAPLQTAWGHDSSGKHDLSAWQHISLDQGSLDDTDPQFNNLEAFDFRLKASSAAIDAGSHDGGIYSGFDADLKMRPLDGKQNGLAGYDIGVSEYSAP